MNKSKIYKASGQSKLSINLYSSSIEAGFPSPADDHLDISLDLNKYLIKHPASTFYIYVKGDSMIDAGINDGDVVVIHEQQQADTGDIVVALIEGQEATLKKLRKKGGSIALEAANPLYETRVYRDEQVKIQGRLVGLIRSY